MVNLANNVPIDIVLENRFATAILVIECKRVQDSSWIFLQSNPNQQRRRHAKAWVTRCLNNKVTWFDWLDLTLTPESPESEYCVIPGQDAKAKPMLERIAADVVAATECIAKEDLEFLSKQNTIRTYFSVIVTTAQLTVGVFDPDIISIKNGTIPLTECKCTEVPYVRFRKQLSLGISKNIEKKLDTREKLIQAKKRTVFIINSENLRAFLLQFEVDPLIIGEVC